MRIADDWQGLTTPLSRWRRRAMVGAASTQRTLALPLPWPSQCPSSVLASIRAPPGATRAARPAGRRSTHGRRDGHALPPRPLPAPRRRRPPAETHCNGTDAVPQRRNAAIGSYRLRVCSTSRSQEP
jgi:hypothetical protein